jgi:hypothetical protein
MDHGIRFIGLIPVFIWAPVRVTFSYKSGFTRVRRRHVHVYAVQSDVQWSVASATQAPD